MLSAGMSVAKTGFESAGLSHVSDFGVSVLRGNSGVRRLWISAPRMKLN